MTLSKIKLPAPNADLGLLILRLMLGVVFAFHGLQKLLGWFGGYGLEGTAGWMGSIGIPLPLLSATMAALAETIGGLALLTGVAFRLVMVPLAFTMFVATSTHFGNGFDNSAKGFEFPLTLAVAVVALFLTGPGRFVLGGARQPVALHHAA